jgi:hypothetical protein
VKHYFLFDSLIFKRLFLNLFSQYPRKALNFNEDLIDPNFWLKRKMNDEKLNETIIDHKEPNNEIWVEVGQSRRCFSCGELKPVQSYNKNEKKKGVEARCISCVATNPVALVFSTICPVCKTPTNGSFCQLCLERSTDDSKKPPEIQKESM